MDKFVVDAGPFIHLEEINQLKLLKNLPQLYIPTSVISEIKRGAAASGNLKTINRWPNVEILSAQRKAFLPKTGIIQKAGLQPGETDCIYLALEIPRCIMLTDVMKARATAEKLSIEVHGSIGLIAYGFRNKWLSLEEAERSFNLFYHLSSLFITYTIVEDAIRSLKKAA